MNEFKLIKEKLEELKDQRTRLRNITDRDFFRYSYELRFLEEIKENIDQLAQEYNNGWIPCSERLPKTEDDVLVWYEYYRYGSYNRLYQTYGISYMYDGKWSNFVNGESGWHQLRIIAWQPLPAPYKEGGME